MCFKKFALQIPMNYISDNATKDVGMKTYEDEWSTKKLIEETSKYKILGRKAETELFREYHSIKDERRRQEIKVAVIQSNLRFVLSLARCYRNTTGLPMSDFFSEGKLGMLEAFNKYDYTCGVKFDSFAVYEVRRHMDMIVNNSDVVRVPVRRRKKVLAARKKGEAVDSVPYDLLADNAVSEPASLDRSVITGSTDHSPLVLSEVLKSDGESTEALNEADTRSRVLNDAMEDYLTPEESNLLRRMYGLDGYEDTVGEISAERHVSKEIIRRIKNRALSKLRGVQSVAELRNALGS